MIDLQELLELAGSSTAYYMHDTFLSTEQIVEAVTGSAFIVKKPFEICMSTGILQGSSSKIYYANNIFNPYYSTLLFKLRLTDLVNYFAFFGFKEYATAPTFNMTESHAGFMINAGQMYSSTGDGDPISPKQQRIKVSVVTPTNNIIYKIENNKFSTRPLPEIYPYFDGLRTEKPTRKWGLAAQNSTISPSNSMHYLVFYISNTTNSDHKMYLHHVAYGEEYAD